MRKNRLDSVCGACKERKRGLEENPNRKVKEGRRRRGGRGRRSGTLIGEQCGHTGVAASYSSALVES